MKTIFKYLFLVTMAIIAIPATAHRATLGAIPAKDTITIITACAEAGDNVAIDHAASRKSLALKAYNEQDYITALSYYRPLADEGDVAAAYFSGEILFTGKGGIQDRQQGIALLQRAMDGGNNAARAFLGKLYLNGDGVTKDEIRGFELSRNAALGGNAQGQWQLAECYRTGLGTKRNLQQAAQWLSGVSASTHREEARALLADEKAKDTDFYKYLIGLKQYYIENDPVNAAKTFKKLEKKAPVEAKTMEAVCLASKQNAKRNAKKAVKLLERVVSESPEAAYYLHKMVNAGEGTTCDNVRALQLLEQAAQGGIPQAQCTLADRLMTGNGMGMDLNRAAILYLAAETQHRLTSQGAINLANCYKNKIQSIPDLNKAEQRIDELKRYHETAPLQSLLKLL